MGRRRRAWIGLAVGLLMAGGVQAQQVPLSCEQSLQEQRYKTNAADMTTRYIRDALATELRQAVERAEKAEHALAAVKNGKPLAPKPAEEGKDK